MEDNSSCSKTACWYSSVRWMEFPWAGVVLCSTVFAEVKMLSSPLAGTWNFTVKKNDCKIECWVIEQCFCTSFGALKIKLRERINPSCTFRCSLGHSEHCWNPTVHPAQAQAVVHKVWLPLSWLLVLLAMYCHI